MREIQFMVNGEKRRTVVRTSDTLLRLLRDSLGLTGAKCGCENGDCGACTVLLDGLPVKSCLILAVECVGRRVTTIEGLRDTPVQRAFVELNALQCGFCTPGMIMNATALLAQHPDPDAGTVRSWMESNLCRCTGYEAVMEAVLRAASLARAGLEHSP